MRFFNSLSNVQSTTEKVQVIHTNHLPMQIETLKLTPPLPQEITEDFPDFPQSLMWPNYNSLSWPDQHFTQYDFETENQVKLPVQPGTVRVAAHPLPCHDRRFHQRSRVARLLQQSTWGQWARLSTEVHIGEIQHVLTL